MQKQFISLLIKNLLLSVLFVSFANAEDSDGDGLLDAMEYGFVETETGILPAHLVPQPKVECDGNVYQIYGFPSQLAKVDFVVNSLENIGDTSHEQGLNAGGYNSEDGYIYAINRKSQLRDVVRIGGDGSVGSIGEIEGLPKYNFVSGGFGPNNLFYVSDYGWLYGIDIKLKKVVYSKPLSVNPKGAEIDLAYDKVKDIFYVTSSAGSFSKIDYHTGKLEIIGNVGSVFGALVADSFGNIYGIDNRGTGLYRFNVNDASKIRVADAPGASQNDAAMCSDIHLFLDTDGDGIDDEYDEDSDGDGIDNITDSGGYMPRGDEDGDKIPNWTDVDDLGNEGDGTLTNYLDYNGDGVPDVFDSDGDGLPNHKDKDSDNDGIADSLEGVIDSDNDSLPDYLDRDSDNDGLDDSDEGLKDTDKDGIPNFLDEDDDNDGILTIDDECPGCNYIDNVTEYDYRNLNILERWGVYLEQYQEARRLWNLIKVELNCFDEEAPLDLSKRGFNEDEFLLSSDSEIIITALFEGGKNYNTLSWYDAGKASVNLNNIWESYVFGPEAPLMPGSSKSLGVLPAGTKLRFAVTSNGANGGTQVIYQDAFRNSRARELVAAKFDTLKTDSLVLAFEDNPGGGDYDFNDVVIKVNIIPRLSTQSGIVVSQFDNDDFALKGLNSNRGRRGVREQLKRQDMLGENFEVLGELFEMPVDSTEFEFEFLDDRSPMKFSLAVLDWSLVSKLDPQSLAFRQLVSKKSIVIMDDRNVNPSDAVTFNPVEYGLDGKKVAFLIIPNNKLSKFASNPHRYSAKGNGNNTKRQCLLSTSKANPGYMDQFMVFNNEDSTLMMIEDMSRHNTSFEQGADSNSSFDDIQILISPSLKPVILQSGYLKADEDVTKGFNLADGSNGVRKGDY